MALRQAFHKTPFPRLNSRILNVQSRNSSEVTFNSGRSSQIGAARLEAVNLTRLRRRDDLELSKLFRACQNDGFFYLDLANGSSEQMLHDWKAMLPLMRNWFDRPLADKMKYYCGTVRHGSVLRSRTLQDLLTNLVFKVYAARKLCRGLREYKGRKRINQGLLGRPFSKCGRD